MPWQERSVIDQREEFVKLALQPGANKRELSRRFGVSRSNAYKWIARYRAEGRAGLADRSRRPHRSPKRSSAAVEACVLELRASSNNAWGGRKIARIMARAGAVEVPAPSTITEILRRRGQLVDGAGEHPGPYQRFERAQPNELWQMDFKGDFALGRGRCHPLTVIDDHSRYALAVQACPNQQDRPTRERLISIFRRYGLPDAMLMDNGAPWGDSGGGPFTAFALWLLRLGVRVSHGRPFHPQTQGKDERFHRTLKAEVLNGRQFADLAACQAAFDQWRPIYNHYRPHQALDLATPSQRYRPSRRAFPETLPVIAYADGDTIRKVNDDGHISFKRRRVRLGKPFRGERVALQPTMQDGVFSIRYCAHAIGTLDLRTAPRGTRAFVDIAAAMPTNPPDQHHHQHFDKQA